MDVKIIKALQNAGLITNTGVNPDKFETTEDLLKSGIVTASNARAKLVDIMEKLNIIEPIVEETVEPIVEETVEPIVEETVEPIVEETVEPIVEETVEPNTEIVVDEAEEPVQETKKSKKNNVVTE